MDKNELSIIGKRIKEIREKNSLTQQQLADKIDGVTVQMVCGYEKGKQTPSLKNLIKISEILNVSLDYLCLGRNEEVVSKKKIVYYSDLIDAMVAFNFMQCVSFHDGSEMFDHDGALIEFRMYDDVKFIDDVIAICETRDKIDEKLFEKLVDSLKQSYADKEIAFDYD